jgi:hypothetical protein
MVDISIHDTADHLITGFAQQQSGDQLLTFTSQHGVVRLNSLPRIPGPSPASGVERNAPADGPRDARGSTSKPVAETPQSGTDIFSSIEKLAGLRDKGFISEEEYSATKTELLKRL